MRNVRSSGSWLRVAVAVAGGRPSVGRDLRPGRQPRRHAVGDELVRRVGALQQQVAGAARGGADAEVGDRAAGPAGRSREGLGGEQRRDVGRDAPDGAVARDRDAGVAGVADLAGRLVARLAGVGGVERQVQVAGDGAPPQAGRVADVRDVRVVEDVREQRALEGVGGAHAVLALQGLEPVDPGVGAEPEVQRTGRLGARRAGRREGERHAPGPVGHRRRAAGDREGQCGHAGAVCGRSAAPLAEKVRAAQPAPSANELLSLAPATPKVSGADPAASTNDEPPPATWNASDEPPAASANDPPPPAGEKVSDAAPVPSLKLPPPPAGVNETAAAPAPSARLLPRRSVRRRRQPPPYRRRTRRRRRPRRTGT